MPNSTITSVSRRSSDSGRRSVISRDSGTSHSNAIHYRERRNGNKSHKKGYQKLVSNPSAENQKSPETPTPNFNLMTWLKEDTAGKSWNSKSRAPYPATFRASLYDRKTQLEGEVTGFMEQFENGGKEEDNAYAGDIQPLKVYDDDALKLTKSPSRPAGPQTIATPSLYKPRQPAKPRRPQAVKTTLSEPEAIKTVSTEERAASLVSTLQGLSLNAEGKPEAGPSKNPENQDAVKRQLLASIKGCQRLACPFAKVDPDGYPRCLAVNLKDLAAVKQHLHLIHRNNLSTSDILACQSWDDIFRLCFPNILGPLPSPWFDFLMLLRHAMDNKVGVPEKSDEDVTPLEIKSAFGKHRNSMLKGGNSHKLDFVSHRDGIHPPLVYPAALLSHSQHIESGTRARAAWNDKSHSFLLDDRSPSVKPASHAQVPVSDQATEPTSISDQLCSIDDLSEQLSAIWVLEHLSVCLLSRPAAEQWLPDRTSSYQPQIRREPRRGTNRREQCIETGEGTSRAQTGAKRPAPQSSESGSSSNVAANRLTPLKKKGNNEGNQDDEDKDGNRRNKRPRGIPRLVLQWLCPCAVTECTNHKSCWRNGPKRRQNIAGIREHLQKVHFEDEDLPEPFLRENAPDWEDLFVACLEYCNPHWQSKVDTDSEDVTAIVYIYEHERQSKNPRLFPRKKADELVFRGEARYEDQNTQFRYNKSSKKLEPTYIDSPNLATAFGTSGDPRAPSTSKDPSSLQAPNSSKAVENSPGNAPAPSGQGDSPDGQDLQENLILAPKPADTVDFNWEYPSQNDMQDMPSMSRFDHQLSPAPQFHNDLSSYAGIPFYRSVLARYGPDDYSATSEPSNSVVGTNVNETHDRSGSLAGSNAVTSLTGEPLTQQPDNWYSFSNIPNSLPLDNSQFYDQPDPFTTFASENPTIPDDEFMRAPSSSVPSTGKPTSSSVTRDTGATDFSALDKTPDEFSGGYTLKLHRLPVHENTSEVQGMRKLEFKSLTDVRLRFLMNMKTTFHDPQFNWEHWKLRNAETSMYVKDVEGVVEQLEWDMKGNRTVSFYVEPKNIPPAKLLDHNLNLLGGKF